MVFWVWFALNRIPNETLSLKIHKFDGAQSCESFKKYNTKISYNIIWSYVRKQKRVVWYVSVWMKYSDNIA